MRTQHPIAAAILAAALLAIPQPAGAAATELVAAWPMNESAGARTMTDSTGHGHRGTIGKGVGVGTKVNGATGYRFPRREPDTPGTQPRAALRHDQNVTCDTFSYRWAR